MLSRRAAPVNVASFLDRAEMLWPRREAVADIGVRMEYSELAARVRGLAAGLAARGVAHGDRVVTLCDNRWELLALYFATARLGAVLVPGNTRLTAAEHDEILARVGARVMCTETAHAPVVAALAGPLPPAVLWIDGEAPAGLPGEPLAPLLEPVADRAPTVGTEAGDVAHLYFTSGTTGRPKGVMLTQGNVSAHAMMTIAELGLSELDVWAHVAPMFHLADAWATFAITAVGGKHVFLRRFEPSEALALLERERVTVTNVVPTMLNRIVREPDAARRDTASLRLLMSGGAPIAPEVVRAIVETFGCEYVQTYGMTETSPYLTFSLLTQRQRRLPPDERLRIVARTGRPVLGIDLRVVDAVGRPVPHDDAAVGEIQVRGPTVTPGYWRDPEATAAAFTDDGFLHTGDLATIDETGSVRIVDRIKDVILTGGESVYSTEVEYRLHEHPAVLEAAVYGLPDPDLGERLVAAVALRPGTTADERELIAFCRTTLAGFKTPKSIRFVDALPRTGTGKISKRALRCS